MSYSDDLNAEYEEAIGLTVEEGGRTWIENQTHNIPHPAATARVWVNCHVCKRRELVAYVREAFTEEARFMFKSANVSVRRWRGLTGNRKFIDHRFCQDCGAPRAWTAAGIEPIDDQPENSPMSSEGPTKETA